MPTAEQFGLIGQVDRTIVRSAIQQLGALPTAMNTVGISINLSGMSVGNADMRAVIEDTLQETGVDYAQGWFIGKPDADMKTRPVNGVA